MSGTVTRRVHRAPIFCRVMNDSANGDERELLRERVREVHRRLKERYPETRTLLQFENGYQLLISVILSAQTTDASVNSVTPELFRRFPDPSSLAEANLAEVEAIIKRTGFFRAKAKNITAAAHGLVERFGGKVPDAMESLLSLPGVGRKTAHVVRGTLFGKPSIIVDTHFSRVTRRLGLTRERDPVKIERSLEPIIPSEIQHGFSMRVNFHGRDCCSSRKPACFRCPIEQLCPYEDKRMSES